MANCDRVQAEVSEVEFHNLAGGILASATPINCSSDFVALVFWFADASPGEAESIDHLSSSSMFCETTDFKIEQNRTSGEIQ